MLILTNLVKDLYWLQKKVERNILSKSVLDNAINCSIGSMGNPFHLGVIKMWLTAIQVHLDTWAQHRRWQIMPLWSLIWRKICRQPTVLLLFLEAHMVEVSNNLIIKSFCSVFCSLLFLFLGRTFVPIQLFMQKKNEYYSNMVGDIKLSSLAFQC